VSGASGSGGIAESYYRETMSAAELKFSSILDSKKTKKSGRIYRVAPDLPAAGQLELFGGGE